MMRPLRLNSKLQPAEGMAAFPANAMRRYYPPGFGFRPIEDSEKTSASKM
jgi:hypothetical protein